MDGWKRGERSWNRRAHDDGSTVRVEQPVCVTTGQQSMQQGARVRIRRFLSNVALSSLVQVFKLQLAYDSVFPAPVLQNLQKRNGPAGKKKGGGQGLGRGRYQAKAQHFGISSGYAC